MKHLVVSFILFMCTLQTFCQQEYFVYLQTENNQAFYVRLNNKVYSSTSSGYLILPKMADNPIDVTIGCPKSVSPEQQFNIPVSHKDAGYIVKNFDEKGWGLLNLQTQAVVMNSNPPVEKKNPEITGVKKTDQFSLLLANAVNDTAVLYTVNKPKKLEPAPVAVAVEEKKVDSSLIKQPDSLNKDSVALVKIQPEKKDSSIVVKQKTDTVFVVNTAPPVAREKVSEKTITKPDSVLIAKNTAPTPTTTAPKVTTPKTTGVKKLLLGFGKSVPKPRKDTIIIVDTNAIAKENERKDAIILMPGKNDGNKNEVAKTTAKDNKPPITIKKDSTQAIKKDTVAAIVENVPKPVKRQRPLVVRMAELLTDSSYIAIFLDESKEKPDTIRISISFEDATTTSTKNTTPPPVLPSVKKDSGINKSASDSVTPVVIKQATPPVKKDSTPVTTQQATATAIKKDTVASTAPDTKTTKAPLLINSDCKDAATDIDIDKLRIKMLLFTGDEDRIALAKKVYRLKCFSVKQVKALSELFKTDEGKYKWFDAVYPFVSDNNNFSSLGELLKNEYYLNRFKAMLRN